MPQYQIVFNGVIPFNELILALGLCSGHLRKIQEWKQQLYQCIRRVLTRSPQRLHALSNGSSP